MSPHLAAIAKLLAVMTVLTDVGIIAYLATGLLAMFVKPIKVVRNLFLSSIARYARVFAFTVALSATSGSLFYSEVAKFTPCVLCWYQRILMYPQTLLIAMGIVKNDKDIADYIQGMSVVGGVIALYHYYVQLGGNKLIPCSTVGFSVDCSQRFSLEFGYITIPMMSLTAFVAIFLLMSISKKYSKNK